MQLGVIYFSSTILAITDRRVKDSTKKKLVILPYLQIQNVLDAVYIQEFCYRCLFS